MSCCRTARSLRFRRRRSGGSPTGRRTRDALRGGRERSGTTGILDRKSRPDTAVSPVRVTRSRAVADAVAAACGPMAQVRRCDRLDGPGLDRSRTPHPRAGRFAEMQGADIALAAVPAADPLSGRSGPGTRTVWRRKPLGSLPLQPDLFDEGVGVEYEPRPIRRMRFFCCRAMTMA